MGVAPIEPGYTKFVVDPQYVVFKEAALTFPTVKGTVKTSFKREQGSLCMGVGVPRGTKALVYIPSANMAQINLDKKPINAKVVVQDAALLKTGKTAVWLSEGDHEIEVKE